MPLPCEGGQGPSCLHGPPFWVYDCSLAFPEMNRVLCAPWLDWSQSTLLGSSASSHTLLFLSHSPLKLSGNPVNSTCTVCLELAIAWHPHSPHLGPAPTLMHLYQLPPWSPGFHSSPTEAREHLGMAESGHVPLFRVLLGSCITAQKLKSSLQSTRPYATSPHHLHSLISLPLTDSLSLPLPTCVPVPGSVQPQGFCLCIDHFPSPPRQYPLD